MDECIEREALLTDICDDMCGLKYTGVCENCRVVALIADAPSADVTPVVHAQWIEDGSGIIICPECKRGYNLHAKYTHYCPNCGAKMDGGDSDETD